MPFLLPHLVPNRRLGKVGTGSNMDAYFIPSLIIGNRVKPIIISIMPQLLPFYFVNQLSFAFLVLITMVYVFGTYILPAFAELFVTRMYITKL